MKQTWKKPLYSFNSGILGLSRFTFGKAAYAIVLVAIVHNLILLPFKTRQKRQLMLNAKKVNTLRLEVKAIKEKYQVEPGQNLTMEQTLERGNEIKRLFQENGVSFNPGCGAINLVLLGGVVFSQAIGEIKKDERFKDGGILWFKDLAQPDPYLVLPALHMGIIFGRQWILPPKFSEFETSKPLSLWMDRLTVIMKLVPVLGFLVPLITRKRPIAAVNLYFITLAGLELAEDYLIKKLITDSD